MEEAPGPVVVGVVVLARLLVGLRRVCEPGTRGIGHAPARQDPPILSLKSDDGFNWMVRLMVERLNVECLKVEELNVEDLNVE